MRPALLLLFLPLFLQELSAAAYRKPIVTERHLTEAGRALDLKLLPERQTGGLRLCANRATGLRYWLLRVGQGRMQTIELGGSLEYAVALPPGAGSYELVVESLRGRHLLGRFRIEVAS